MDIKKLCSKTKGWKKNNRTFVSLLYIHGPLIRSLFCLIWPFSFVVLLHQDKSTPEDQSSWDSFKTMTPELSIVPGDQKDRMELHNKNWDSSSANTPDSSEGDFQTEVWRHTDVHSLTWIHTCSCRDTEAQRWWTSEKLYISDFPQRSHTHCSSSPPMCSVGSHTVFVYCCSGQTWKGDCSTLYFHKDYWKVRTGAWHVCDWWKFLNELKKNLWKTYFWEKKMSWFYSEEKKKISFNCLMIWGGKGKEEYFCTVQFFL